ncbi:MAG: hypothetical protein JO345_09190 [Streptosporangiaceae bacterium]|nr:hypothetical protein [Streptosporangiaceae bacterium]
MKVPEPPCEVTVPADVELEWLAEGLVAAEWVGATDVAAGVVAAGDPDVADESAEADKSADEPPEGAAVGVVAPVPHAVRPIPIAATAMIPAGIRHILMLYLQ